MSHDYKPSKHFANAVKGRKSLSLACLIAAAVLAVACVSIIDSSEESYADASGSCGNGLTYTYTELSAHSLCTLSIQKTGAGSGELNFSSISSRPWNSYCGKIQVINIGYGVTSIGNNAFSGCAILTSVNIQSYGVTSIGNNAFSGCVSLKSIDIPDTVTTIGNNAFEGCTSLASIDIPDEVTSIGNNAFSGCVSFKSINIPDAVTSIGYWAFKGCTKLASVTIGNGVESIGARAFEGCTSLASIDIPDAVTSIGSYAFYGCTSLASVTIGNGVGSIPENTFFNCTSLASVTIGNGVGSIGARAFEGCTSLASIDIPGTVTKIGFLAFKGCTKLASVTIGNGVAVIDDDAFDNCTSLTSIDIPSSVASIGKAFYNCDSLSSINVDADNSHYSSDAQGILYNWSKTKLIICPNSKKVANIPSSVTSIDFEAFYNCSLVSVDIPSSVISIGYSAFFSCNSLASIDIPDSVTSIGDYAFEGCTNLLQISFGKGLTELDDAFPSHTFYDTDGSTVLSKTADNLKGSTFKGQTVSNMIRQQSGASHHVTYDANGGSASAPVQADVAEGSKFTVASYSGTKSGYAFGGWSYGGNTYQPGSSITMGKSDIILTAVWNSSVAKHHVTYDLNGGSGQAPVQEDVAEGSKFTVASYSGTKSGYAFGGWSYGGKTYQPGSSITMGKSDIALTAVWIATHHVTYDLNGGSGQAPVQEDVAEGQKFTVKACGATKEGYVFDSWVYKNKYYIEDDEIWMGTEDIVLVAYWYSDKEHVAYYRLDGGSGSPPADQYVLEGDTFTLSSYSGTKSGYTFGGWIYSEDDKVYAPGTVMTMGKYDMEFTAKWVSNVKHTVSFDANGGSGQVPASFKVAENEWFTLPGYSGAKEGYVFDGWSLEDMYPTLKPGQEDVMLNADQRYYAQWSVGKHVTDVSLDKTSATVDLNGSLTLHITISPADATIKDVYWSSSNWSVAEVSGGVVTIVGPGTATITVRTVDGNFTATCAITVNSNVVNTISISSPVSNPSAGSAFKMNCTITPYGSTAKVAWSSSDTSIATVDGNGNVKCIKSGTVTITAEAGGKKAQVSITISGGTKVTGVTLDKTSLTLEEGGTYELKATVSPDNASDKTVTWKSSNTGCVTVDNGRIKAVKEGTATITVTTNDGGKTATCTVKVEPSDTFEFDRKSVKIRMGEYDQLRLVGKDVEGAVFATDASWIVSLDEDGTIRGLSPGWVIVSAALNGKKATCTVTVEANEFTPTLSERDGIATITDVDSVIRFIDNLEEGLAPLIKLNLSKATEVTVPKEILNRLAEDPISILEVASSHASLQFSGELLSTMDPDADLTFHLEFVDVPSAHAALKPYLVIEAGLTADDGSRISSFSSPVRITFSYIDDHSPHYNGYTYYLPESGSPVEIYGRSVFSGSECTQTFETDHFSAFALVVKNEKGEPVNPDDPEGGSGGMDLTTIAIAGGAILAIAAIVAAIMLRRRRSPFHP